MSTPKKSRRHTPIQRDEALWEHRSNDWRSGIHNPDIAMQFTLLCTEFEHVEDNMARFLAELLGVADVETARVVYHTLRNPSIKLEILRTLLERTQKNSHLGPEFDALLSGYDKARQARNHMVHGLWWTDSRNRTFVSRMSAHGYPILDAKERTKEEFDALIIDQQNYNEELSGQVMRLLLQRSKPQRRRRRPSQ